VDSGEVWPNANSTPLLVEGAGRFPKQRVIAEFDVRSRALDPQVRLLVRDKAMRCVPRTRRRH